MKNANSTSIWSNKPVSLKHSKKECHRPINLSDYVDTDGGIDDEELEIFTPGTHGAENIEPMNDAGWVN